MDCKLLYENIIARAVKQNRVKSAEAYYEAHHILPRCQGGQDNPENLVLLRAREHFIAHELLCKIHPDNEKLAFAFHMMSVISPTSERKVSSRSYKKAREALFRFKTDNGSITVKHLKIGAKYSWMKKDDECTRVNKDLIHEYLADGWVSGRLYFKRMTPTDDTRQKMSDAQKGRPGKNKGKILSSRGKTYEQLVGVEKAAILKACRSKERKGNPRSKLLWKLVSPSKKEYLIENIKLLEFMQTFTPDANNGIKVVLSNSASRKCPVHHGILKGWQAERILKEQT